MKKMEKEYKNDTVSIKRKLIALRRFFGYLFTNDMISANVIDKIDIPKVRDKEIIRMNRDEMDDFLNQVEYGNFKSSRQNAYHEKQKYVILRLLLFFFQQEYVYRSAWD